MDLQKALRQPGLWRIEANVSFGDISFEESPFWGFPEKRHTLVALPKPGGGHRPIAVGEVLRRVVGKCLAAEVRDQAWQYLEPRQVGVGTPAGAEAVVHTVRQWVRRHRRDAGRVLVKLDLETPSTRCCLRYGPLCRV